jgi:hypothetical protein
MVIHCKCSILCLKYASISKHNKLSALFLIDSDNSTEIAEHIVMYKYGNLTVSLCLSVCLCLSIHLSILYLSVYLSVRPSVRPSVPLPSCLSACLPVCLSVRLSVCLSVHPLVSILFLILHELLKSKHGPHVRKKEISKTQNLIVNVLVI